MPSSARWAPTGTSIAEGRPLTPGETALARGVFGESIDLAPVRLHRRRWWPLQPREVLMAPDGHIWCHPQSSRWSEDYAAEGFSGQGLFIHEMTHVWQHQRGLCLPLARLPFARYRYRLRPGRPFSAYGVEQQAEIVRHAFLLGRGAFAPTTASLSELSALLPFGRTG